MMESGIFFGYLIVVLVFGGCIASVLVGRQRRYDEKILAQIYSRKGVSNKQTRAASASHSDLFSPHNPHGYVQSPIYSHMPGNVWVSDDTFQAKP